MALHEELVHTTRLRSWLLPGSQQNLHQLLREVEAQREKARREPNLSRDFPDKTDLLIDAGMAMQIAPRFRDLTAARQHLEAFETALKDACPEGADRERTQPLASRQAQSQPLASRQAQSPPGSRGSPSPVSGSADGVLHPQIWSGNAATRIGLLAGALLLGLLAMFGIKRLYDVAYALVFNRRSCQIPAVLQIGLSRLDGRVTILGRVGARFALSDSVDQIELYDLAETDDTSLRLGHYVVPAHILVLEGPTAGIHFEVPLTLPQQKKMLTLSFVAPYVMTRRRRLIPEIRQFSTGQAPRPAYVENRRVR